MASRLRTRALFAACSIIVVSSLAGLGVVSAAGPATADAANDPLASTAYQENPAHDGGYADSTFGPDLHRSWSVDLGGSVGYPIIAQGLVFAPISMYDEVDVEARSLATGDVVWGPKVVAGTSYAVAQLTYDEGQLFVLGGNGELTAFDAATGAKNWVAELPGTWDFTSAPTAADGTVYIDGPSGEGTVSAVDEATGQISWQSSVEGADNSAPVVGDGGVFVAYDCQLAYRFDTSGNQVWSHPTSCEGGGGKTAVLHDGSLYVRSGAAGDLVLDAATGKVTGTFASSTAPAFDASSMATEVNGALSLWDTRSGTRLWTTATNDYVTSPVIANGYVVEGHSDGTVDLRREQDGSVAWSGSAGAEIDGPDELTVRSIVGPSIGDGVLVVPAGTQLSAFTTGPDPDPWVSIATGPTEQQIVGPEATFSFATDVPGARFQCTLDRVTSPCASPVTYRDLASGYHYFSVSLDGLPISSETRMFTVNAQAPAVAIFQGPAAGRVIGPRATFTFASGVPGARYQCTMDQATKPCRSPMSYGRLSDGAHLFSVSVTDHGMTGTATRAFTVDAKAPRVRLGRFRPIVTHSPLATAHWSASDRSGVSRSQLRLRRAPRGGSMPDWTSRRPTSATSARLHVRTGGRLCVSVRAEDGVGNWSAWTPAQCVVRMRPHH